MLSRLLIYYESATYVLQLSKNEQDADIKQKAAEIGLPS